MKSTRKRHSRKQLSQAQSSTFLPMTLSAAGAALTIVVTFLVYLPSLNGDFILDDDSLVTANKLIKASDGLHRIWCSTQPTDYWPVTNTTFWIEWRLWGMNSTG